MSDLPTVRKTLKKKRDELMKKPNVVATGIGFKKSKGRKTDELSIICSVSKKKRKKELKKSDLIPSHVDGVLTDVIETGTPKALIDNTAKYRPAPGGVSIGHKNVTAGTLGCVVEKNNKKYILSNNHVLANSNKASKGDEILQPGPHDDGNLIDDHIAELSQYIPIIFEDDKDGGNDTSCNVANVFTTALNVLASLVGSSVRVKQERIITEKNSNKVDAAIAEPLKQEDVKSKIIEIGEIAGTAEGTIGTKVKKSGRTTGLTNGTIEQIDVTARVNYGNNVAVFTDQLMAGPMSDGGDSGSVVLDENNNVVGLLFAGSDSSTIINRIDNVTTALNVSI